MKNTEKKIIKKWTEVWKKAGTALLEVRTNEMRADDYYKKNQHLINQMLWYVFKHQQVRYSSGLIEQQRLFKKFYKTNHNKNE